MNQNIIDLSRQLAASVAQGTEIASQRDGAQARCVILAAENAILRADLQSYGTVLERLDKENAELRRRLAGRDDEDGAPAEPADGPVGGSPALALIN